MVSVRRLPPSFPCRSRNLKPDYVEVSHAERYVTEVRALTRSILPSRHGSLGPPSCPPVPPVVPPSERPLSTHCRHSRRLTLRLTRMSASNHFVYRAGQKVSPKGGGPLRPAVPAIVLVEPKYAHNVGQVVRNASCYGISQVWYTGNRVKITGENGYRLPREERMKGYADVSLVTHEDPLTALLHANPEAVPVAIELRPGAERLPSFVHPDEAIYVFGPEDGSLHGPILKRCHRFVVIPSLHCLNVAMSVGTVLYDRMVKSGAELTVTGEQRRLRTAR